MNRRIITLELTESDLFDGNKCAEAVKSTLNEFFQTSGEASRIKTEFEKYFSVGEPKINNLINKWKYLADTSSKAFFGSFPEIYSKSRKKAYKSELSRISEMNRLMLDSNYDEELASISLDSCICGKGYGLVYTEEGSDFPLFKELDPNLSFVVYDCSLSRKPLFGVAVARYYVAEGTTIKLRYSVNVYGKDWKRVYKTPTSTEINTAFSILPQTDSIGSIVEDPNGFMSGLSYGSVPLLEFDNNQGLVGDAWCVDDLIKTYNEFQTKRVTNISKIVDALLVLTNVDIGTDDKSKDSLKAQLDMGMLAIKSQEGKNSDAKYLTNPLNQEQMKVLSSELESAIHKISQIPDFQEKSFSENTSAPVLNIKTKPLLDLVKGKEKAFSHFLMSLVKIIQSLNEKLKLGNDISFDDSKISFHYLHPMPSNDTEICTQMVALKSANALNISENVARLSFVGNVDDYLEGIDKNVDTSGKTSQNGGVNPTNSARKEESNLAPRETGGNPINELSGKVD